MLINHRMHEDDLSGMLLAQQAAGGDQWTVVEMPAISEGRGALARCLSHRRARAHQKQHPASILVGALPAEARARGRHVLQARMAQSYTMSAAASGDEGLSAHLTMRSRRTAGTTQSIWLSGLTRKDECGCSTCGAGRPPRTWVEVFCDLVCDWKPMAWAEEKVQITAGIGP